MKNSKKVFLTGERGVGKTTAITRFVTKSKLSPMGFNTVAGGATEDPGVDYVYIIPYGKELDCNAKPVAKRDTNEHNITKYPESFDSIGVEILTGSQNAELIIMDELGFMEADAKLFQKSVLSCLDLDVSVLGVIKPMAIKFLDAIRAHKSVEIIEVTVENRETVLEILLDSFLMEKK